MESTTLSQLNHRHVNFKIRIWEVKDGSTISWDIWNRTPIGFDAVMGVMGPLDKGNEDVATRTDLARNRAERAAMAEIVKWLDADRERTCTVEIVWMPAGVLRAGGPVNV